MSTSADRAPPTPAQRDLVVAATTRSSRSSCRSTDAALHVLLWQHDRGPAAGSWALPGGPAHGRPRRSASRWPGSWPRRSTSGTWPTWSSWRPGATSTATPAAGCWPPPTSGWCRPTERSRLARRHPLAPRSRRCPAMAFDHASITSSGVAPAARQAQLHQPRLRPGPGGLHRVRAAVGLPGRSGARRLRDQPQTHPAPAASRSLRPEHVSPPGRSGGRPAAEYRFRTRQIEVTDQFAVLRPPEPPRTLSG